MLQTVTLGFHSCTTMRFEHHVTCVWWSCFWLLLLLLKLVTCLLTLCISFSYILLHRPQFYILHFTLNFVSLCYVSMSRLICSNYCFYLLKLLHWMRGIIAFKQCAGFYSVSITLNSMWHYATFWPWYSFLLWNKIMSYFFTLHATIPPQFLLCKGFYFSALFFSF